MNKLKIKENMHDKALFIPEGYSSDHKADLQRFAAETQRQKDRNNSPDPMRSLSSAGSMEKGLSYRFKLKDLQKYSQRLHYKDINWKLKLSALGKKIPDIKERKKILFKCSHFSTLLRVLKNTDWS